MTTLLLHNATLLDCTGANPKPKHSVLVENAHIKKVGTRDAIGLPKDAEVIDLEGMTLMPGLTDSHLHLGWVGTKTFLPPPPKDVAAGSLAMYAIRVVENIELALNEGFTTVRDAGGLDPVFATAVSEGAIKGPRILPSGSIISQTGGQGDHRSRYDDQQPKSIPGLLAMPRLCDSPAQVRAAVREQLRQGATQIKIMCSGGIISPTSPLENTQFTVEELRVAVQEAQMAGKSVMAHCHTDAAIENALDAGIRSIEHATFMGEATASRILREGAFVNPTLLIKEVLHRLLTEQQDEFNLKKLAKVRSNVYETLEMCMRMGLLVGSASDLIGPKQSGRAQEIVLKAKVLGPMGAILSATQTNARVLGLEDRIGTVEEGKEADLIAVAGDPLSDINILADGANIRLVLKGGHVMKKSL